MVSVFPPDVQKSRQRQPHRPHGEILAGLHPAFLRFPGGNYLEGDHINERYEWKKTIGPLVDRPTHPSPWNYHSSDGLGLLGFLEWCGEPEHAERARGAYGGYSMKQEHCGAGQGP